MNDRRTHAHAFMQKAENDIRAARLLFVVEGPLDTVCFHAQQAAEKALKAVLAAASQPILRTHNLEDLQALALPFLTQEVARALGGIDLTELTPYAVQLRYDVEFTPDGDGAERALRTATHVFELVKAFLENQAP